MTTKPPTSRVVHAAVTVSSESRATALFEGLFGLPVVKAFDVGAELTRALFDMDAGARAIVYGAVGSEIEVFVCPERVAARETYDHICLAVEDRAALLERAEGLGMTVSRFDTGTKVVVFLRDTDGNLFELKEA